VYLNIKLSQNWIRLKVGWLKTVSMYIGSQSVCQIFFNILYYIVIWGTGGTAQSPADCSV